MVRILYSKVYNFLDTHRYFVPAIHVLTAGSLIGSHNYVIRVIAILCHTAAVLDAAHGNVQQPAHNFVAI